MIDEMSFCELMNRCGREVNALAHVKGFWPEPCTPLMAAVKLALIGSEISEGLEAVRNGNPPSDHCSELSALEEELADAAIRIMDLAVENGMDLGRAILVKHQFNKTRPPLHGKLF